jgi:hypothetical protein
MIEQSQSTIRRTEHAMLVAWGDFSRLHHLAERLRQEVFIPRHHENIPAGDLILEFGLLLLSGSTQLQDLNLGPRPLAKDEAVKEAWDVQFGHYTTVSRALKASTAETVAQVVAVLGEISRPFIDQEVQALAAGGQELVLHADLSGRPVSSYSQTYPEARWGHMGDTLALGHQHALITMQGLRYRLHLAGFLHPGDTVSQACLRELIQATERESCCRPRRRVELVMTRIQGLQNRLERYSTYLSRQQQALLKEQERQGRLENQLADQRLLLATLEAKHGDKPIKPYSRLAKARQRQETWQRQLNNARQRQVTIQRKTAYHQRMIAQLTRQRDDLSRWHAELEADNATNLNPVRIRINLDGGFSGGDNLTYLIEMGYDPLAVGNGQSAEALRREQPTDAIWTTVTPHVALWEGSPAPLGGCPYPLRRILQHWQGGDRSRYSLLLQYQDGPWLPLTEVFPTYHQRQHAEAGVKQGKSVFGGRGVRIRSAAGLELLNQFAFVFWPNFVHWATDWLRPRVQNGNKPFEATLQTVKTQVRVAAQTPATVFTTSGSRVLVFTDEGPYPEVRLQLAGIYAFQLPLLLYSCEAPTRYLSSVPRQLLSPPNG